MSDDGWETIYSEDDPTGKTIEANEAELKETDSLDGINTHYVPYFPILLNALDSGKIDYVLSAKLVFPG